SLTLLDSFRIDAWVHQSGFWVSLMTVRNKFDNEDRLTETETTLDGAGYQLKFRDIHVYDGTGNNILIDQFLLDEGEEYHAGQWTMQYSGNLLIEEVFSTPDGFGGYLPDSRTTYAYTPSGQTMLVRNYAYDLGNDTWMLYASTEYTYDPEDRLATEIYSTYAQGEMDSRSRTTYQYYTGTHLGYINYDIYDFNQGNYVLNTRRVYYYEPASSARPVKALVNKLLFAPNPASSETYVFVDQGGQMAIYDLSGRIMSQQLLNPGPNPVDLSQLPGGVYVAMMTSLGKTVATGNIIRQ
ncbi:MAG: T9SS type A sorting domain-containing protein, partial [Saprospiraceae bacterium]|nr:T9SS type A sorting domain-containing protein [Saprospiraceae bacterium]